MQIDYANTPSQRYSQELLDTNWKLKADSIRIRDKYECRICGATKTQLDVHHLRYIMGRKAWEYDDGDLVTLCRDCHEKLHAYRDFKFLEKGGYFYHKYHNGVGIITQKYDDQIDFDICWTEKERDVPEHGRIWVLDQAFPTEVRPATEEEIIDFWNKIMKYCVDTHNIPYPLDEYLNKNFVPKSHPLWTRLDAMQKNKD